MAEGLTGIAFFILFVTGGGVYLVLRSQPAAERMMAVQLLGTGGAAATLLLGAVADTPALTDMALLLVLFAALSCAAFALAQPAPAPDKSDPAEAP